MAATKVSMKVDALVVTKASMKVGMMAARRVLKVVALTDLK